MNRSLDPTNSYKHLSLNRVALIMLSASFLTFSSFASPYVELASYTGKPDLATNTVTLNWTTAAQIHNDSFTIYRSKDQNTWVTLTTVQGVGHSTQMMDYSYVDNAPISGSSYYMLEWRSSQGMLNSSTIQVTLGKHHHEGGTEVSTRSSSAAQVDLINFTARFDPVQDRVNIAWATSAETSSERFMVYRSKDQLTWTLVDRVVGAGNSTTITDYLLPDADYYTPVTYYKLEWEEANGPVYALTIANLRESKEVTAPGNSTRSLAVSDLVAVPGSETGDVRISWFSEELEGTSSFALYRSTDLFNWQLISDDAAKGSDKDADEFLYEDTRAPKGTVHYKLEWYDEFGNVSSSTTSLEIQNGITFYRTFPNPTTGVVRIASDKEMFFNGKVRVISSDGNRHRIAARTIDGQLELDLSNLSTGIYIIELDEGYARVHKH